MTRWLCTSFALILGLTALPCPALACTLCSVSLKKIPTFRMEANSKRAQLVVYGRVVDSKLSAGTLGGGVSALKVSTVFKADESLPKIFQVKAGSILKIPRYVPVEDKKNPPRYLIFAEVFAGKLDPFRAEVLLSEDVVRYVQHGLTLDTKNRKEMLKFYFDYLEHRDPKLARDAFVEFARASDSEVGEVARELSTSRVRTWLQSKSTPTDRLGLYAFLLGANGEKEDGKLLRRLIDRPTPAMKKAMDGLLSGYALIEPKEAWAIAYRILGDTKEQVHYRMAVFRMLQFNYGWQPEKSRPQVLKGLGSVLKTDDLADYAIERLRKWKMWEHTDEVLALYGREDSPYLKSRLVKQTIVRYAMQCPKPEAKGFIEKARHTDKAIVQRVEEQLEFEKLRPGCR